MGKRIDYYQQNKQAVDLLLAMGKHISALDPKLKALVELRVSQINGCVYCVDLHSQQARAAGETQQRLDCLVAWEECPFFDEKERALWRGRNRSPTSPPRTRRTIFTTGCWSISPRRKRWTSRSRWR
jgi:AhpD family alkylhydroperoxidase